jgi:effector-binding domain-containing protein
MSYPCELKEQAAQPTLIVRATTPVQGLPQVLGQAYGTIAQYLGEMGEQPAGPPFVLYHNMDMQALDIEAGFVVAKKLAGKGEVQVGEIPAGKIASVLYTGPYDQCGPAYEALAQFVKEGGGEATGAAYEFYLNDPQQTPPQELQTLIVFPIKSSDMKH